MNISKEELLEMRDVVSNINESMDKIDELLDKRTSIYKDSIESLDALYKSREIEQKKILRIQYMTLLIKLIGLGIIIGIAVKLGNNSCVPNEVNYSIEDGRDLYVR